MWNNGVCVSGVQFVLFCETISPILRFQRSQAFSFFVLRTPESGGAWLLRTLPCNPGVDCLECALITSCIQPGECDDLEDKPSCTVFCFALLAVFAKDSVMVSILRQMQSCLHLTS